MKLDLTEEDAASLMMKEELAKDSTVVPHTAAVFARHQQLKHALKQ